LQNNVIARSVHRYEAIYGLVGDCFGRENTARATT
jgi:hypothetical protein